MVHIKTRNLKGMHVGQIMKMTWKTVKPKNAGDDRNEEETVHIMRLPLKTSSRKERHRKVSIGKKIPHPSQTHWSR